ncbi:protein aurora borealis-like [Argiope bruennichi]|uniref:protein aurora borealis-like n=1 Tax=Argiope bruennichi TaxID=94029 RepID=UPI002494C712|nr:protein aurora borealis-like [Argiope bruennichi]XP_055932392.1 protein aurora borealis-like [Argiope bruennichi]XP_055932393.1 protein aurora borealis-like [Argiope bruennichi]XP_055932395.1 protein aurora borealis-like [Argiope bruennichi]XP_055932396.1 protein aurora borealis-like [Argiope bruennichi]
MDRLQKISPSTSAASLTFNGTPKRTLTPLRPGTPLHVINEENDNVANENRCTPVIRNPFDVKAESLYLPACSPSVFATLQRNEAENGSFRWSIEHLSYLYPADIDETSLPETRVDEEQEVKAQKAIDAFFSQSSIVPSPWSSSPKEGSTNIKPRRRTRVNVLFQGVQRCEATTQTSLSIPPNVDLTNILGKYFTFNEDEENNTSSKENSREDADSSTSSLRRKLFVADEENHSPCRSEIKNLHSTKRWSNSPVHMRSVHSTPSSDVLSSSPITPPNCSDSCNILSSPPVSPIKACNRSPLYPSEFVTDAETETYNIQQENEGTAAWKSGNNNKKFLNSSVNHEGESFMSFCAESQETNPFPSYVSEKQDTGYATGSIASFQNMTSSETNYGVVSRISPVTELMEECELSNSASCDMSFKNDYMSIDGVSSADCQKANVLNSCNFKTYTWVPTCCSTPAQCTHSQQMTK